MSECFYCRSFLWHSSHFSLFHSWINGLVLVRRFIPNHGQTHLIFILSVLPWLSNDVAESCSSLFVSDTLAVLKIKEWISLVFAWKLHLQWPRDVFWVTMVVLGLTRHNRQWIIDWWCLLARECMPWCSGISLSCPCWWCVSWSFWRWWKQAYSG